MPFAFLLLFLIRDLYQTLLLLFLSFSVDFIFLRIPLFGFSHKTFFLKLRCVFAFLHGAAAAAAAVH